MNALPYPVSHGFIGYRRLNSDLKDKILQREGKDKGIGFLIFFKAMSELKGKVLKI